MTITSKGQRKLVESRASVLGVRVGYRTQLDCSLLVQHVLQRLLSLSLLQLPFVPYDVPSL